jgi:hypothetical protein
MIPEEALEAFEVVSNLNNELWDIPVGGTEPEYELSMDVSDHLTAINLNLINEFGANICLWHTDDDVKPENTPLETHIINRIKLLSDVIKPPKKNTKDKQNG